MISRGVPGRCCHVGCNTLADCTVATRLPRAAGAALFVYFDFEFCRVHAPLVGLTELFTPSVQEFVAAVMVERNMGVARFGRAWLQILPMSDPGYLVWRATQETQQ